jgi:hypothetical protein
MRIMLLQELIVAEEAAQVQYQVMQIQEQAVVRIQDPEML